MSKLNIDRQDLEILRGIAASINATREPGTEVSLGQVIVAAVQARMTNAPAIGDEEADIEMAETAFLEFDFRDITAEKVARRLSSVRLMSRNSGAGTPDGWVANELAQANAGGPDDWVADELAQEGGE